MSNNNTLVLGGGAILLAALIFATRKARAKGKKKAADATVVINAVAADIELQSKLIKAQHELARGKWTDIIIMSPALIIGVIIIVKSKGSLPVIGIAAVVGFSILFATVYALNRYRTKKLDELVALAAAPAGDPAEVGAEIEVIEVLARDRVAAIRKNVGTVMREEAYDIRSEQRVEGGAVKPVLDIDANVNELMKS